MRILPKNIHKKNTVYKWFTLFDMFLLCILLIPACVLLFKKNFLYGIILVIIDGVLFIPTGDNCLYQDLINLVKFLVLPKDVHKKLTQEQNGVCVLSDKTYVRVISLSKINLSHKDEAEQTEVISYFERALKCTSPFTTIYIVKEDEKLTLNEYSKFLFTKSKEHPNKYLESVIDKVDNINLDENKSIFSYYLILKSRLLKDVEEDSINVTREIEKTGIETSILSVEKSIKVIDKICFTAGEGKVTTSEYTANNHKYAAVCINGFPRDIPLSFGYDFMIEGVNVLVKMEKVDKEKAVKRIDRVLQDTEVKSSYVYKSSEIIENDECIDILTELLKNLKVGGEVLFDFTIYLYIDLEKTDKKTVKGILSSKGYRVDNMHTFEQSLINESQLLPNTKIDRSRSVSSKTLAAIFPFIYPMLSDDKGDFLGQTSEGPFILDIWKRNRTYQNSNGMVIGRSGSGKSYFLKSLVAQEHCLGTRVVILDPENEYSHLVTCLGGKVVDVGSASEGIVNPFEIFPGDDISPFRYHLKVLENFFRVTLDSLDETSFEYLNSLAVKTYITFNISDETNFSSLKPSDYPTFSDLYNIALKEESSGNIPKDKIEIIKIHLRKFTEGRYSDIYNKHSSFTIKDSIVSFNFQSLFMGKNGVVANASMLLIFNYLEGQMVRNFRENSNEHLLVICDEAHLFIDERYPVSLDFFYQMNKRIRKYGGSFIPATQSISDWMSNDDIRFKTSSIIKNSQYLYIFHLSSPDIKDLRKLYEGIDSFDEDEISSILSLPTGEMLFISSSEDRGIVKVEPTKEIGEIL